MVCKICGNEEWSITPDGAVHGYNGRHDVICSDCVQHQLHTKRHELDMDIATVPKKSILRLKSGRGGKNKQGRRG